MPASLKAPPALQSSVSATVLFLLLAPAGLIKPSLSATRVRGSPALAVPFTLETESFFFDGEPNGRLAHRETTARRSNGITAKVDTFHPGMPGERRMRFIKYIEGRNVQLVDAITAKTTWPKPPATDTAWSRNRILNPPKNCVFGSSEIFLRIETVLGHKVAVVSASYTNTEWRAPDLGCEVLQRRVGYKHNGVFKYQSETRAVRLKLGEPDSRLFDEGAGYAELKPSELLRRMLAKAGIPWDANLQQEGERSDKIFFRSQ